jgi:hypothetical protein
MSETVLHLAYKSVLMYRNNIVINPNCIKEDELWVS